LKIEKIERKREKLFSKFLQNLGKFLFFLFFLLLTGVLFWLNWIRYEGNFHKVTEDIYRSGQLYRFNLPQFWEKYRFKTILNLRGRGAGVKFEEKFAREHNLTYLYFPLSDRREVPPERILEIVKAIASAPKPVLIHCKSGADRTGLIVASYLQWEGNRSYREMLSLRYGHFPYLGSPTGAMDKSLEKFVKFSNSKRLRSGKNGNEGD
jgi:protein tyrosine/serine phosphatase